MVDNFICKICDSPLNTIQGNEFPEELAEKRTSICNHYIDKHMGALMGILKEKGVLEEIQRNE